KGEGNAEGPREIVSPRAFRWAGASPPARHEQYIARPGTCGKPVGAQHYSRRPAGALGPPVRSTGHGRGRDLMQRFVVDLQELDRSRIAEVGGKAAQLAELSRIDGVRVPPGFCVTSHAFERAMAEAPALRERIDRLSRLEPDDREA